MGTECDMALKANKLFWYFYHRKRTTPWPLRYSVGVPLQPRFRKVKEEIRWAQVNITVKNLEGQDEVSLETSVLQ